MKPSYCFIAAMLLAGATYAQNKADTTAAITPHQKGLTQTDSTKTAKHKGGGQIILNGAGTGLLITNKKDSSLVDKKGRLKNEEVFSIHWVGFDLGIDRLQDKTNYNSAAAQTFLHVNPDMKNSDLFNLRTIKSINVNLWPVLFKYRLFKSERQKIYLVSGIGLQLYNFSFNKPVTYTNTLNPAVVTENTVFTKNKLAFDYLTIPLQLTFKTKLGKQWLVYGAGVTGGYLLEAWTKQVSSQYGKQKNHNDFNFQNFNSCITGEIGIDGIGRLFASYQVTSLQSYGLNQHPFSIGLRFLGI